MPSDSAQVDCALLAKNLLETYRYDSRAPSDDPVAMLTIKASRAVACGTDGTPRCPTVTLSPGGTRFTVWPTGTFPDVLDGRYPVDIGATLPSVTSSGTPADGTLLTRCRTVEHA